MVVTIVTLNNLKLARPHNSDLLDIPTTFSWHLDSASWAPMQSQVEAKVPREQKQMNVGIWWNMQVSRCYTHKSGNKGHSQSSQPIRLCFCCFSRKVYMWIKERTRNKSVLKTGFGLLPELCLYVLFTEASQEATTLALLWPFIKLLDVLHWYWPDRGAITVCSILAWVGWFRVATALPEAVAKNGMKDSSPA